MSGDNPPAFACANADWYQQGMTLRDWFAGQAPHGAFVKGRAPHDPVEMAVAAYRYADAMLIARGAA